MKKEIMIRRLAEKTGTPILEDVLLGKAPITDLPDGCMIWTGRKIGKGADKPRLARKRDYTNQPYITRVRDHAYGIVCVEKRLLLVHRYIFMLLNNPNYEFRMTNQCGNTLCCNPTHWEIIFDPPEKDPAWMQEFLAELNDPAPWTQSQVTEIVDRTLLFHPEISSWEELVQHVIDCPPDMIREALTECRRTDLAGPSG